MKRHDGTRGKRGRRAGKQESPRALLGLVPATKQKTPPIRRMEGIAVDMVWLWLRLYNFSAVQMSGVAARVDRIRI